VGQISPSRPVPNLVELFRLGGLTEPPVVLLPMIQVFSAETSILGPEIETRRNSEIVENDACRKQNGDFMNN